MRSRLLLENGRFNERINDEILDDYDINSDIFP
jgi:hypothetical protein